MTVRKKYTVLMPWYLFLVIMILGVWGWVQNLATVWNGSFTPLTGEMIIRVIGIFFGPLGAILGYF
jgi:hypothetical protein